LAKRPAGKDARHLALDPTNRWLLIANHDPDTIAVFARDSKAGKQASEGRTFPQHRPRCLYLFK
jgi:6-phosphogluconolactonase